MDDVKRPSIARLREALHYDPQTGFFTWRIATSNRVKSGARAGSPDGDNYRRLRLDGCLIYESVAAWAWMTGEWSVGLIDHEDLDRTHNAWINLRAATYAQNNANQPKSTRNTSGFKGVTFSKLHGRWRAQIGHEGTCKHIGLYDTKEEAHAAYAERAIKLHGEFARTA